MNSNIKWENDGDGDISAMVGAINMYCWEHRRDGRRTEYRAFASIRRVLTPGKRGCLRLSQAKAKEDAIRLANELLQDLGMALTSAIKTFEKATKIEVRG